MIKYILLLFMGLVTGWLLHANFHSPEKLDLSAVQRLCNDFEINPESAWDFKLDSSATDKEQPLENCSTTSTKTNKITQLNNEIIDRILKGREITPQDLSVFTYWQSYQEFENFVSEFSYTNSQLSRLFAKAEIFYNMNFVVALEKLYSAKAGAFTEQELDIVQGEINALLNYVREIFFSLESPIDESQFVKVMEMANEKTPDYLPALLALIKHYLFIGDFTLAKNYINSIPLETNNQSVIDLMNQKLNYTKADKGENHGGIPMRKSGNHFVVKVNINNDISLNLLLDTGASRTAVSVKTLANMQRMSNHIIDLQMARYVRTANGRAMVNLYQAKTLEVGGFVLPNPLILSMNLHDDKEVQGLLGMDFLSKFQFRIDHEKGLLYLSH